MCQKVRLQRQTEDKAETFNPKDAWGQEEVIKGC